MAERLYNDDEAQQILQMAARGPVVSEGLSEAKLVETAAELGIRPEEVYAALRQFETERTDKADRAFFRQKMKRDFMAEVTGWLSASALMIGINFLTNGVSFQNVTHFWALWPVGIWGVIMVVHAFEAVTGLTVNFEQHFQHWRKERDRKEAKKAEKAERDLQASFARQVAKEELPRQSLDH